MNNINTFQDLYGMEEPVLCECCTNWLELSDCIKCDLCGRMVCSDCYSNAWLCCKICCVDEEKEEK